MLSHFTLMLTSFAAVGESAETPPEPSTEARIWDTASITITVSVRPPFEPAPQFYDLVEKDALKDPRTNIRVEKIDDRDLLIVFQD